MFLKSNGSEGGDEIFAVGKTFFEFGSRCIEFDCGDGGAQSVTKIVISDKTVDIHKSGELGMFMRLEEGKSSEADIHTPYGVIPMLVNAKTVSVKDGGGEVDIFLEYEAERGGEKDIFNLDIKCRIIN